MTQFKSKESRWYCKFCNIWTQNNKISISSHEQGPKHKEKVQEHLKRMAKENSIKKDTDRQRLEELDRINKAAAMAIGQYTQQPQVLSSQLMQTLQDAAQRQFNKINAGTDLDPPDKDVDDQQIENETSAKDSTYPYGEWKDISVSPTNNDHHSSSPIRAFAGKRKFIDNDIKAPSTSASASAWNAIAIKTKECKEKVIGADHSDEEHHPQTTFPPSTEQSQTTVSFKKKKNLMQNKKLRIKGDD